MSMFSIDLVERRARARPSRGTGRGSRPPDRSARCRACLHLRAVLRRSARPRMPPWMRGCSVLTRPSRISGAPVKSPTSRTGDARRRAAPAPCRRSTGSRGPRRREPRAELDDARSCPKPRSARGQSSQLFLQPRAGSITRVGARERGLHVRRTVPRDAATQARPARRRRSAISALVRSRQPPIVRPSNDSPPRRTREIFSTRMPDQLAGRLERARPRLGDDHLDPGVLLGRGQPVDRSPA